ncbi:MAG: phosphoribosylformylglycinamidine synthase subunit PurL [Micavibrio aeruginosavorus]|nr:phosphoribosylformylglycinamidine synthase subunit PurL [Micavibrio aeruginosavorus]
MLSEPEATPELAGSHGLSAEEYDTILKIMGRTPSFTELGIFSVMWSEHCSYKSSRIHLKKLPTAAPWVIQGPGENAGVIDIGDGQAAVFKMESHNHPSYIEPYQGAATGVGGIMRDVFTMGARPIANMNALRFGDPAHPKTRSLVSGVIAGIAGYGNCMGVPTVGGETNFHKSYNGNILVNAMTVGLVDQDKIYYARGAGVGQPVVYVGSKTGRDGIHGATMASAEFDNDSADQRPTVQVGDPFVEKLLLEACLELMEKDAIICIQDMGAAGLTSSSVEIADKGGIGVHLDLDRVPMREPGMSPYEIMLSESQERMLMILKPGREDEARAIFEKWDLDFAVIGITTADRRLKLSMHGRVWCDMPVPPLVDQAPVYDRPCAKLEKPAPLAPIPEETDMLDALVKLLSCPDLSSKRWIWEQYDSLVRGETVSGPGIAGTQASKPADAAIVRIPGKDKALAVTTDCTPRYCHADPFEGAKQAVAESWRNLCAAGATPLAITNNLNFGNPQKPDIMAQFVAAIDGIAVACRALDYPVISGNVSLHNETNSEAIFPTPAIGGVGVMADWKTACSLAVENSGLTLMLIGGGGTHLGQSLYLREILGREDGTPPAVDLEREKRHGLFIRNMIATGHITACHDLSDGGLLVALAEMLMAGNTGATLQTGGDAAFWFGEDQGRYAIATKAPETLEEEAKKRGIPAHILGLSGGDSLKFSSGAGILVNNLIYENERWLPACMEGNA